MKFSWKALLLAPLCAPLVFGLFFAFALNALTNLPFLLILFAVGGAISYGATVFLLLPALFLLAGVARLTFLRVCGLGTLLGCLSYLPMAWMSWASSGPDSGPPVDSFFTYLWRSFGDPWSWVFFPAGGLLTAGLYWALCLWTESKK